MKISQYFELNIPFNVISFSFTDYRIDTKTYYLDLESQNQKSWILFLVLSLICCFKIDKLLQFIDLPEKIQIYKLNFKKLGSLASH